jgi:hypothetical protein
MLMPVLVKWTIPFSFVLFFGGVLGIGDTIFLDISDDVVAWIFFFFFFSISEGYLDFGYWRYWCFSFELIRTIIVESYFFSFVVYYS